MLENPLRLVKALGIGPRSLAGGAMLLLLLAIALNTTHRDNR